MPMRKLVVREPWPVVALAVALAALAAVPVVRGSVAVVEPAAEHAAVAATPWPVDRAGASHALVARVVAGHSVAVRSRPGGAIRTVLGSRTEFDSPRALGVIRRKGRWLGVPLPELGNGRLGWINSGAPGIRVGATRISVEIDLSARRLVVKRSGRVARRVRVSVGRRGSPTPTGRFAVTDKLAGARFGPAYGCCILGLSGRQPNLPVGWTGGDRLAIHGGAAPFGRATSAGCLHASERDLQALMRAVPLGAQVRIHP